ncbi:hypothetical protein N7520_003757 [Penicillium odoratum]|uniref:uncharacterized protein n=1 Tax=Penicillium odoratum TaxID=1167516 RepID=UPI002548A0B7|nr:uncharacterized protein N7520_003757 [Penicillium odoratum]KAJ5769198.1 hypothetical protein N7520_003757 [Penicillium odoratum]
MYHPSDNIPWHLLASNLHWAPGELAEKIRVLNLPKLPGKLKEKRGCVCGVTNLHPSFPAPESPDEDRFAQAFVQAVYDDSKRKRAQYPEKYSPPSPSDVLLGDELVGTIESHLSQRMKGGPRLPFEQRTAFAFLHPCVISDHCRFTSSTKIGFLNLEVVKMLLMLGELDPILQACAHPDVGILGWYSAAFCDCLANPYNLGWDVVLHRALLAYIALNIALCFPKICDPTAGRTDETDYRHTGFYQYMLREITQSIDGCEATPYPHQQFFGIPCDHFCDDMRMNDMNHWLHRTDIIQVGHHGHYGLLSFDEFLNLEGPLPDQYQPSQSDVESVKQILLSKSFPLEIVFMIMYFADYKAKRVLEVPHDPLHPANRAEMNQYLDQCWQIIIGCEIMNHALGGKMIDWRQEIHSKVKTLFHQPERPWVRGQGRGRGRGRGRGGNSVTGRRCFDR